MPFSCCFPERHCRPKLAPQRGPVCYKRHDKSAERKQRLQEGAGLVRKQRLFQLRSRAIIQGWDSSFTFERCCSLTAVKRYSLPG